MQINNLEELLRHIDRHQEDEDLNEFLGLIEDNRLPVDTARVTTLDELISRVREALVKGEESPDDAGDISTVRNGHIQQSQFPDFPEES
jgi:hypothetical protein